MIIDNTSCMLQPRLVHMVLGTLLHPVLGVVFTTRLVTTRHCSRGQV